MIERLFTRQHPEFRGRSFISHESFHRDWIQKAGLEIPTLEVQSCPEFNKFLPEFLKAIDTFIDYPNRESSLYEVRRLSEIYGAVRARIEGYRISDLVKELACGREIFLETMQISNLSLKTAPELRQAFDVALAAASEGFLGELEALRIAQEDSSLSERSRREVEEFFSQAPVGICILEGPRHVYTYLNPTVRRMLGQDHGQIIGKPFCEALPEVDPQFSEILDQVYQTGETYIGREHPIRILKPNGSEEILYFNLAYQPRFNNKGQVCGITNVFTEVTEQVRARQAVEEQQKWLETVLNRLPLPLMLVEAENGQVSFLNHSAEELLGVGPLLSPEVQIFDRDGAILDYERLPSSRAARGEELRGEEYSLRMGERVMRFAASSQFLPGSFGRGGTALLVMQDITPIKVAQEAAESANSAKSIFLASMSHEIRTPLSAIMGFLDLMKTPLCTREDLLEYVRVIERNSTQLLRLVDDILDLSKVEAGKIVFERIEFSLTELLSDFQKLMAFKAFEKNIQLQIHIKNPTPECLLSDPTPIRQILTNVVGNAIKFTEQGRVDIEIEYKGDNLHFTVTDTGRGISNEQASRLFTPFTQAEASTTRSFGGTGLGLILTKRLCEAMGGFFLLRRSAIGQGSCFEACVEVKRSANRKMIPVGPLQLVQESLFSNYDLQDLSGMKLLLVEDSVDNQVLLKILLTNLGAQVDLGSDGFQGVSMALQKNYDAILMDVQMPVMDGHQATRELRAQGYAKPIIALTAHAMLDEKKRCVDSGFSDFLTKPFQREELIEVLQGYRLH